MREPLFRKKTPEEGTGWTVNNGAGWIATGAFAVVLGFATVMIDSAFEDQMVRLMVTVGMVLIGAVGFTLFAKWESERP